MRRNERKNHRAPSLRDCGIHAARSARACKCTRHFLAPHGTRRQSVSFGLRSQNLKRVSPPGSLAGTTVAERGQMRCAFHGGGPCDGALNGASVRVLAAPLRRPPRRRSGCGSHCRARGGRRRAPRALTCPSRDVDPFLSYGLPDAVSDCRGSRRRVLARAPGCRCRWPGRQVSSRYARIPAGTAHARCCSLQSSTLRVTSTPSNAEASTVAASPRQRPPSVYLPSSATPCSAALTKSISLRAGVRRWKTVCSPSQPLSSERSRDAAPWRSASRRESSDRCLVARRCAGAGAVQAGDRRRRPCPVLSPGPARRLRASAGNATRGIHCRGTRRGEQPSSGRHPPRRRSSRDWQEQPSHASAVRRGPSWSGRRRCAKVRKPMGSRVRSVRLTRPLRPASTPAAPVSSAASDPVRWRDTRYRLPQPLGGRDPCWPSRRRATRSSGVRASGRLCRCASSSLPATQLAPGSRGSSTFSGADAEDRIPFSGDCTEECIPSPAWQRRTRWQPEEQGSGGGPRPRVIGLPVGSRKTSSPGSAGKTARGAATASITTRARGTVR